MLAREGQVTMADSLQIRCRDLIYDLAPWQGAAIELAYRGFASPVANRYITAALVAASVIAAAFNQAAARGE